ncbi:MAG: DUF5979 domain-containing protein, partial [Eubacteriaceae bacterium]|nr:DUF5979 domain-containing protein [Eubacteriaceae bacterium]
NIGKAEGSIGDGTFDTIGGLQDTNDTLVNAQKYSGNLEDANAVAALQDPTATDTTSGDKRENTTYGYGSAGTEGAHEYLYGSYTDEDNRDREPDTIGPDYMDSLIASWTVTDPDKEVSKIRIRMDSGNTDADGKKIYFTGEVDPRVSDTITVPYQYFRYVTQDNGTMSIVTEHRDRTYTVKRATKDGKTVVYLTFNHFNADAETDEGYKVLEADVINNVEVDLELSARLEVSKTVDGTYGDKEKMFNFKLNVTDDQEAGIHTYTYRIVNSDGSEAGSGSVTEGTEATVQMHSGQSIKVIGLPYGSTYTVSESNNAALTQYTTTVDGADGTAVAQPASLTATALPASGAVTGVNYSADRFHAFINTYTNVTPTGLSIANGWILAVLLIVAAVAGGYCVWRKHKQNQSGNAAGV